jgi:hypothetical protein
MFIAILSIVLVGFTPTPSGAAFTSPVSAFLGGGGPDSFGYRYLDSDTVCPGAPVFNWVDIKSNGTEITALGDDNYVGPFPIGFEFPFYWYKVHTVFVGSNGYVTFDRGGLSAAPFNPIPGPQLPNNCAAPLCSDLDCSSGGSPNGSVWYKATPDSFIVEWDSVAFWSTGGNNSFQIILSRPDSTITFQYKEQSGAPYQGWSPTTIQVGIEDISGTIGLNYLSGTVPPQNMIHDSLAVLFYPPESTRLRVHDVGIRNAMNDRNGGFFTVNGRPLSIWANVRNFGNQPESSFKTYFRITRQTGSQVFLDSLTCGVLAPDQSESLHLVSQWWPSQTGVYYFRSFTRLAGDMTSSNDTATLECRVVTLPANLAYDGGTPGSYQGWPGFGNRFVPPVYPCSVSSFKMNMQATTATDCYLGIFDDDGANGSPGTALFLDTVSVSAANWYTVNLASPVVITDGAFFVGGTAAAGNQLGFGMDSIPPISYQGWEYTGVWAPSRNMTTHDACANATVSGPVGIFEEGLKPQAASSKPAPTMVRGVLVLQNGSSASSSPSWLLDITGRRVLALKPGANDVSRLAPGVYFVRVAQAQAQAQAVHKVVITR